MHGQLPASSIRLWAYERSVFGLQKPEDIGTAINAVKGIIEVAKGLKNLRGTSAVTPSVVEKLDLNKLEELQARLINFRTEYALLQEENIRLKRVNVVLEERLSKKQQGIVDDHAAWKILENSEKQGPYCPNCFEKTGRFIKPHRGALNDGLMSFICGELKSDRSRSATILRSDFSTRW
jgi:hypothetical protein